VRGRVPCIKLNVAYIGMSDERRKKAQ